MENNIEILKSKLNISLTQTQEEKFKAYAECFLKKNEKLNLISKNDEKVLFEKHIFDSLAINLFFNKKNMSALNGASLLDIGTGGGFPSIPIALLHPELKVVALDSIRKKINVLEEIKTELEIKNLYPMCQRAENIKEKFDYITSRAVAPVDTILKYAAPLLNKDGFFVAYKSKKALEELKDAKKTMTRFKMEVFDVLEYQLPLEEPYERNLIIFKFK